VALTEQKVVKQVTHLPQSNTIQVQWANQILRDGEFVSETYERKAYMEAQKNEFLSEVNNALGHVKAMGWK